MPSSFFQKGNAGKAKGLCVHGRRVAGRYAYAWLWAYQHRTIGQNCTRDPAAFVRKLLVLCTLLAGAALCLELNFLARSIVSTVYI